MTNDNPTFTPLKPTIGVEVHGIDISQPVSDDAIREINDALCDNGILLFRDQDITPEQHIAFSERFGRLEPHIANQFNLPGHPDIFIVSNIVEDGRNIGASGGARHWHFDYSYREFPSLGSLFYCLECPPEGGETHSPACTRHTTHCPKKSGNGSRTSGPCTTTSIIGKTTPRTAAR